jgi:beta-carotene hydroxylase
MQSRNHNSNPPHLLELGSDLLELTAAQRVFTLAAPLIFAGIYFYAAFTGHWVIAVLSLIYLSFVTYGSTSHDLVHRNLGLPRKVNETFLTLIELISLRSGHAYRLAHLFHHAHFPDDEDIEAAASKKTFVGALVDGVSFHLRIWLWACRRSHGRDRAVIVVEGSAALVLIGSSVAIWFITPVPLIYVILMLMGAWITPLITSYIPHNPNGANPLEQTRVFRGRMLSVIALEHLYHLEHHLYPAVPHQHWPELAKRLDPYLKAQGIQAKLLGF